MSKNRSSAIVLYISLFLYFIFRWNRINLPHSIFRNSFPSLLFSIVYYCLVSANSEIVFKNIKNKSYILLAFLVVFMVWFELLLPIFYKKATGDIYDCLFMLLGFLFCFIIEYSTSIFKYI